ncbi:hypothetical protein RHMOL_Rhmol04G0195000 [Rhododendron molle]|uniref:Uncharacterized protein n=1 Tax=Rhododendron molle TaxID=49168 RepID=A0ACC0P2D1_RHOML|nr:hypothetical protein RHMOL_Rhmol04G0195000 [Rhododendron molle]
MIGQGLMLLWEIDQEARRLILRPRTLAWVACFRDAELPGWRLYALKLIVKFLFHALCICLLHYHLLGPSSGHADSMLLDFAQQMGNRVGFASLVLAKTLIGLDTVKGNPTTQFSGSPLLLQVRLYEKLRVWDVPD